MVETSGTPPVSKARTFGSRVSTRSQEKSVGVPPDRSGYTIVTTRPDTLIRHDISDEELGMLEKGSSDKVWDAMWAFCGAAIGAAPNAIASLWEFFFATSPKQMDKLELFQLLIFIASLGIAIALLIASKRTDGAAELVRNIRERSPKI